jgi:hypothetical protein
MLAFSRKHRFPQEDFVKPKKESNMLWTIFVILLILWGLGLMTGYTMGGVIMD